MPEQPRGKRRRGTQSGRRPDGYRRAGARATQPVGNPTISRRVPGIAWLGAGAIVVIVLVGAFLVLRPGGGAGASASPGASAVGNGTCPKSQPPALAAGQTRTVTFTTPNGAMVLKIQADLSPIAAGNFVALASCGYYDGTPFHRTATLPDGTPFVIQGGDPTGTGGGGPGYTITDEPVTTPYKRGTVAMARSAAPNSVGSQFFIVLDDKDAAVLSSANTYQIIGSVTSGMTVADAIYTASAGVELPTKPIHITAATVANP
jgi:cyclophilin family peptidyl-prolyl cis-trans isomerase